jgi:hypothetical protein
MYENCCGSCSAYWQAKFQLYDALMTTGTVATPSPYLAGQRGGAVRLDILSSRLGVLEVVFAVAMAALIVG